MRTTTLSFCTLTRHRYRAVVPVVRRDGVRPDRRHDQRLGRLRRGGSHRGQTLDASPLLRRASV